MTSLRPVLVALVLVSCVGLGAAACSNSSGDPPPPPAPTLTSITPAVGDLAGGQVVTLRGSNLGGVTGVVFGAAPASGVTPGADGTSLTCLTPPNARGVVTVTVSASGGSASLQNGFSYVRQINITQVDPNRIPAGTDMAAVTVRGTGLVPPLSARVTTRGDFSAPATVDAAQSTDLAARILLPALDEGEYFLTITNGENQLQTASQSILVTEPIRVTEVDPNGGFADESTFIRILGTGFDGVTAVQLGGTNCSNLVVNPTLITCDVPPSVAGPVDVVVRRSAGDETRVGDGFTYYASTDSTVRVLYADPRFGRDVGGQQTRIAATGLNLGTPVITVGGTAAQVLSVEAGKHAVVVLPPNPVPDAQVSTMVPISVTVAGTTDTRQNAFTYFIRPEIASIMPQKGATVGGDIVTIIGRGFTDAGMRVKFDGFDATDVQRISPTRLQCRIPSHVPAVVDVQVISAFDGGVISQGFFEYVAAVRITRLDPPTLSIAGGNVVIAEGSGFVPSRMELTVGTVVIPPAEVIVLADSRLQFVAPRQQNPGQVLMRLRDINPQDPTLATGEISVEYQNKTMPLGGVTGGAINKYPDRNNWPGNISVQVTRQDTGAPVAGAEVFIGNSWQQATLRRTTDDRGMTVLAATGFKGPVTITAARTGFENQTRVGVDASEVTFNLLPVNPEQGTGGPRMSTLTGSLANWAQAGLPLGAAAGQVKRIAVIWVSEPDQGLLPPNPGNFNVISEEAGCDISPDGVNNPLPQQFTINAYEGTKVALLAAVYFYDSRNGLCEPGSAQMPNQEQEGLVQVIAGAMGLLTDIDVRPGTNPNLIIPVNRTVTDGMQVTLTGAPVFSGGVGNTARTVDFILDVGASGVFTFFNPFIDSANWTSNAAVPGAPYLLGLNDFFNVLPTAVPAPGGDLKYIIHGMSGAPLFDQGNNVVALTQPQSEVWKRQVQDISVDLSDWFQFPEGLNPGEAGTLADRTFRWNALGRTHDFVTVDVGEVSTDGMTITPKWSVILPANVQEFTVPSLGGAPNVEDITPGQNLWQLGGYKVFDEDMFNYNDHNNGDLGEPHMQARIISQPVPFNMP